MADQQQEGQVRPTSGPVPQKFRCTPARKEAVSRILGGRVTYIRASGEFHVDGELISGAARRTYVEMRRRHLVSGGGDSTPGVVTMTELGRSLTRDWQFASR